MNNERDKKMSRATSLALDIISLDEQIIAQLGRSGFTEFALGTVELAQCLVVGLRSKQGCGMACVKRVGIDLI